MTDNLIGEKLGNYRLERLLGRGRMGVVYLARDEALLRPTAVKVLSWSLTEADGQDPEAWFIAEARNVARINHPHVVQIYGVARHGPHCYLAMEYVDGTSADVWIARNGPFTVELATELLIQAAGALQAAHDANVVHRDVKPENLLVRSDGKAKLGDFGMALNTARTQSSDAVRAGTPYYTAPEIWCGSIASISSDIYALGATYYYLLTGQPPFTASDLQAIITAHLQSPILEMNSPKGPIPAACFELVSRCMAKVPSQRFLSAQAVGWEARGLLRKAVTVPPPSEAIQTVGAVRLKATAEKNTETPNATGTKALSDQSKSWFIVAGFEREPFARYEMGSPPYQGEPFQTVRKQMSEYLAPSRTSPVFLAGVRGSGRTCIIQDVIYRLQTRNWTRVPCVDTESRQSITRRILWSYGVPTLASGSTTNDVDVLVEHCLSLGRSSSLPVIVVDDCNDVSDVSNDLMSIVLAAGHSNAFRLVLTGSEQFENRLRTKLEPITTQSVLKVSVGPLRELEVGAYVNDWIASSLANDSFPFRFSPDAMLLIAYRSGGLVARINRLVSNLLIASTRSAKRFFDSWDVWTVADDMSTLTTSTPRPLGWPTSEVLQILNNGRAKAGIRSRQRSISSQLSEK